MQTSFNVLGQTYSVECSEADVRRLVDLAQALEARLGGGLCGDSDALRRLVLTALSLLDEAQATGAALARARCEIERLTDMVVEAKLAAVNIEAEPSNDVRGRVDALRLTQGAA